MSYCALIFLAAFFAMAGSWFGFVLAPQLQVGRIQQTNTVPEGVTYPIARAGLARQGLDVYRANGCAACHSQQVGQRGTVCDVVLSETGTNEAALITALRKVKPGIGEPAAKKLLANLPVKPLAGVSKTDAEDAVKVLNAAGGKAALWIVPVGSDIARGWGKRRTVAEDYLYDYPVQVGSQRVGPDLSNVGVRQPDANWHLLHLYAPSTQVTGSIMPAYRFLFEKRRIAKAVSPDALRLSGALTPEPGYEIVPTHDARELVAYLLSLRADAPLYVAPLTVPPSAPASTNAPATNATANAFVPLTVEELSSVAK